MNCGTMGKRSGKIGSKYLAFCTRLNINMKFNFSKINKNDGFIVQVLYLIFFVLERFSVFYWIRVLGKKISKGNNKPVTETYIFPEIWVVFNISFAILVINLIKSNSPFPKNAAIVIFAYSFLRVVEMFVYQINVLFFHRLNQYMWIDVSNKSSRKASNNNKNDSYVLKSATRTIIMLVLNMIEYVLQFSVMFGCLSVIYDNPAISMSLFDSFKVFMLSSGTENVEGQLLINLVNFEVIIGIFMNILCISRFINELPGVRKDARVTFKYKLLLICLSLINYG